VLLTISTTVGAINFVATILRLRAPGMAISRKPLFLSAPKRSHARSGFPAIADRQLHVSLAGNLGRQLKARFAALRVGHERHGQHGDVIILPKAACRVHNLLNRWLRLHQR